MRPCSRSSSSWQKWRSNCSDMPVKKQKAVHLSSRSARELKASYTCSLRPHTLVATREVAQYTRARDSLAVFSVADTHNHPRHAHTARTHAMIHEMRKKLVKQQVKKAISRFCCSKARKASNPTSKPSKATSKEASKAAELARAKVV